MRILYDASRLMSRADRSSPTGVDRVCLAYAEWLLARPDVLVLPEGTVRSRLFNARKRLRELLTLSS